MANTISVNVVADIKNISRGIDTVNTKLGGMEKSTSRIGSMMKGAFVTAGAAIIGGGIVSGITDIITKGSDLNETISKTDQIFGTSSVAIQKWAGGAAKSMGLSKQAALDGATGFGNFFQQIGFGAGETEKMSKSMVQAAVDLGSFHNAAPVDVMNALSAATRGEYDSLQKYIPTINAATVEQKAFAGMTKDQIGALTEADKTKLKAKAVHEIVMGGMGKANGDYARTSGSLANQQKSLTAQFDNMKTSIGTALLPMFTTLATWINTEGIPALKTFAGWFKDNVVPVLKDIGGVLKDTVLPALKNLGSFIMDNIPAFTALGIAIGVLFVIQKAHAAFMAVQAVGGLVAYIAQMNIVQAITKTWAAVQWVLNVALSANPIALVIIAIVALIAIIVIAWKNSETFRNIVIGAWNAIKTATSAVWNWIKDMLASVWNWIKSTGSSIFNGVKSVISTVWNAIKAATSAVWNGIKAALSAVWEFIKTAVTTYFNFYKAIITTVWNAVKSVVTTVWNFIKGLITGVMSAVRGAITGGLSVISNAWSTAWNTAKNLLSTAWTAIKTAVTTGISNVMTSIGGIKGKVTGALSAAGSWLYTAGRNIIQGLINGIGSMAQWIKDKIGSVINGAISWAKNILGIASPSKVFKKIGSQVGQGLAIGIARMENKVASASGGLATAVEAGFNKPALSLSANFNGAGNMAGGNTYAITVEAPVGSSPEEIGRTVVEAISAFEGVGGTRWRTA